MTRREQWVLGGFAAAVVIGAASLYWHDQRAREAVPGGIPVLPSQAQAAAAAKAATAVPQEPPASAPPAPAAAPLPEPAIVPPVEEKVLALGVAVMGAVRAPGYYTLKQGDRVYDALQAAGGAAADADMTDINLLANLIDATTITVPHLPQRESDAKRIAYRRSSEDVGLNPSAYLYSGLGVDAIRTAPPPVRSSSATDTPSAPTPEEDGLVNLNTATSEQLETLPGIGPAIAGRIIAHRDQQLFSSIAELKDVSGIGDKKFEAIQHLVTAP
jgi:competence protein ComEA